MQAPEIMTRGFASCRETARAEAVRLRPSSTAEYPFTAGRRASASSRSRHLPRELPLGSRSPKSRPRRETQPVDMPPSASAREAEYVMRTSSPRLPVVTSGLFSGSCR